MPKVYGQNPSELGGKANAKDLSPSDRLKLKQSLHQLGFKGGADALKPKKDAWEVSVGQGSFKEHVYQVWWIRRQAQGLARMMGKDPGPDAAGGEGKQATKAKPKVATAESAKEHRSTGRLSSMETTFGKLLGELRDKVKATFDTLVYNKSFDMITLKQMDRHTLAMYMAKAEADVQELTMLHSQLCELMPMVSGAPVAVAQLSAVSADIALLQVELSGTYRTMRQESMVIRTHAPEVPPEE